MSEQTDGKRIARQWKRQIDDEDRREAARPREPQPWRAVVWGALWLLWLVLLLVVLDHAKVLR